MISSQNGQGIVSRSKGAFRVNASSRLSVMVRSTVRTNGHARPGGTQRTGRSQPSRSQNRRRHEEDEEEEEEEEAAEEEQEEDAEEKDSAQDELTRKANALVRLALFNESRHMPLRRDEINKRVLGENTRQFNTVFAMAQRSLQSTFGFELVELMSRADLNREQNANDEIQDDANATGLKKKATASGSKSYILRSTLASELIQIANEANEELLDLEFNEEGEGDEDDETPTTYGSILNWTSSDQLGGLGLLYVILSLILVNGHTMSDPELKQHLKTFRLSMSTSIEFVPHATQRITTIESYLASLVKQGQLDKVKLGAGGAPRQTQGKRGRGADLDDESATYEWRWGPRAHAEIGECAVAEFIAEFMAERVIREYEKDGDEEGGQRMTDEERDKVLSNYMKEITRAAGGKLSEIR
ncbi:MAGE-domain-containing protein [Sanghuangporus baumii]|uniref:MAGE-domain-containing protein n=1 Tax=Sanghuangporus baumii TaxID=108892 RepID=A0A9Q5I165_SANBA|nr:MAGE-domain-containing protein [Sanghuangporus baumii]